MTNETPPEPLAALLKRLRRQGRLTQEQLAERALLSTRAVSDLERGVNRTARTQTALLLADALGLGGDGREQFLDTAAGATPEQPAAAVEAAAEPSVPSGFPAPQTALIGRQDELAAARRVLGAESGARLLTLVGPGGVGKTRLATALGRELAPRYADGAAFVALADLGKAELVANAAAEALELSAGTEPARDVVRERLRSRQTLLVLDNMEHLPEATELVAELLDAAERLHVVVTSRVALGLRREQLLPVGPLTDAAAVELFSDRCAAIRPGWQPPVADGDAIAELCLRLDGLPLAIELAAARSVLLSPRALLERVGDRLDALGSGAPDLPERQRTLGALVAWSYDLLADSERDLFDRLGVFRGGFTVAAADRVCGADTLDGLGSLVDSSLAAAVVGAAGEPRVAMLETIRLFAVERLVANGQEQAARDAHMGWAVGLAAQAEPALVGPSATTWLAVLDAEHDNMRAALSWAVDHQRTGAALRLAAGLWRFWYLRGHLVEGRAWVEQTLELPMDNPPPDVRSARIRATYGVAILAWLGGDLPAAEGYATAAREALSGTDHDVTTVHVANLLGMIAQYRGDLGAAERMFDDALTESERLDDPRAVAVSRVNLGTLATGQQRHADATAHLEAALAGFRRLGDERSEADVLNSLGDLASRRGDLDAAVDLCTRSLDRFAALSDPEGQIEARQHLADFARSSGDVDGAHAHLQAVRELATTAADPWGQAAAVSGLARLAADRGDPDEGSLFHEALALHSRLEHEPGVRDALQGLARVARKRGNDEQAEEYDRRAAQDR